MYARTEDTRPHTYVSTADGSPTIAALVMPDSTGVISARIRRRMARVATSSRAGQSGSGPRWLGADGTPDAVRESRRRAFPRARSGEYVYVARAWQFCWPVGSEEHPARISYRRTSKARMSDRYPLDEGRKERRKDTRASASSEGAGRHIAPRYVRAAVRVRRG